MNQNDQMLREALRLLHHVTPSDDASESLLFKIEHLLEQALEHTPATGKMVRLTEMELWRNDGLMALNAEFGLLFPDVQRFANAIMDAFLQKNGLDK